MTEGQPRRVGERTTKRNHQPVVDLWLIPWPAVDPDQLPVRSRPVRRRPGSEVTRFVQPR